MTRNKQEEVLIEVGWNMPISRTEEKPSEAFPLPPAGEQGIEKISRVELEVGPLYRRVVGCNDSIPRCAARPLSRFPFANRFLFPKRAKHRPGVAVDRGCQSVKPNEEI